MFVGHLAAGLVLKARVREAPLGMLIAGTAFLDVVHGLLGMIGVEHVVVHGAPVFANWELAEIGYSHSLLVSVLYSVACGALAARWWRSPAVGWAIGLSVFSHFVLDLVSHNPDLPVVGLGFENDLKLGTGLARHPLPFFLLELGWCLAAWYVYDAANRRLLLVMLALMALWANNVFGFALPPVPPAPLLGVITIVSFAIAGWCLWWAARTSDLAARR